MQLCLFGDTKLEKYSSLRKGVTEIQRFLTHIVKDDLNCIKSAQKSLKLKIS